VVYRFLLTDAVPYQRSIRAGLEGGSEGDLAIRARTVAYHYVDPRPPLVTVDVLDLGNPVSRADHGFAFGGAEEIRTLDGLFEGEPPEALEADGSYREAGTSTFQLDASRCTEGMRLRRLWDAGLDGQHFDLDVGGQPAGGDGFTLGNQWRRWSERDYDLGSADAGQAAVAFEMTALPAGSVDEFSAFRYELLCRGPETDIFSDGFEMGDASAWSGAAACCI
jgi:hypothetical protein